MSAFRYFLLLPCIFIFAFCVTTMLAPSALAQEAAQGTNYDDVPDKYIQEAQKVYRECTGAHTRRMFYDCKCYSMAFLDERIYRGPVPSQSTVESALQKDCRDATEAAGYEYSQCLNNINRMKPGTDPEKLCECYANRFAQLINFRAPTLQSRTIRPYKIQAKLECNDPVLASKLLNRAGVN
jgi:hypothetical protein